MHPSWYILFLHNERVDIKTQTYKTHPVEVFSIIHASINIKVCFSFLFSGGAFSTTSFFLLPRKRRRKKGSENLFHWKWCGKLQHYNSMLEKRRKSHRKTSSIVVNHNYNSFFSPSSFPFSVMWLSKVIESKTVRLAKKKKGKVKWKTFLLLFFRNLLSHSLSSTSFQQFYAFLLLFSIRFYCIFLFSCFLSFIL